MFVPIFKDGVVSLCNVSADLREIRFDSLSHTYFIVGCHQREISKCDASIILARVDDTTVGLANRWVIPHFMSAVVIMLACFEEGRVVRLTAGGCVVESLLFRV